MKHPYRPMSFQTMYDFPKVAALDDLVVLNDNFDHAIHMDSSLLSEATANYDKLVSSFNILVCLSGHVDLMANMKDYRLEKNDVVVNMSGTLGSFYEMSEDCKFLLLIVNGNFYEPFFTSHNTADVHSLLISHPVCHLSDETTANILSIYKMMKENMNSTVRPTYIREVTWGLVQAFYFNVISQIVAEERDRRSKHEKTSRSEDIYKRFLEAVEKNYMREREIKYYADLLCLTPKYLSRIVYKESGSYAGEHIKKYVIIEAKALIKSRKYTMSQICDILNFNSQSFFTKYFKSATGLSPTEYQNQ